VSPVPREYTCSVHIGPLGVGRSAGSVASKGSRKWHPDQEELLLECLIRTEFRFIGGDGNGVMERKAEARWMRLPEYFLKEDGKLAESLFTACELSQAMFMQYEAGGIELFANFTHVSVVHATYVYVTHTWMTVLR
jgi:hypothetical protein